MNKQEMVKAISNDTGLTQVDVNKMLNSLEKLTIETIQKGDKVQLTGFVTIKPAARSARKGYDPIKLQAVEIAPTVGVSVKAGEKLKKASEGLKYEDFKKEDKKADK